MSSLLRLRIRLHDEPGGLARVAAVIGRLDGNITGIDVMRGFPAVAIDELTVEFAHEVDLAELRRAIERDGGAAVISHQRASLADPVVRIVRELLEALDEPPADRSEQLRRRLCDLCSTPAGWILAGDTAASFEVGRRALATPGAACLGRSHERLPHPGEAIAGEASVLAITAGAEVVLLARSSSQPLTATEADRVEALVAFHVRLGLDPLAEPSPAGDR